MYENKMVSRRTEQRLHAAVLITVKNSQKPSKAVKNHINSGKKQH